MSTVTALRIGEFARRLGVTPRTVRYYEELGLLSNDGLREAGQHRLYTAEDEERLRSVLRVRDLLGVNLQQLGEIIESMRLRDEYRHGAPSPGRRRAILHTAATNLDNQLARLRERRADLDELEIELTSRRALVDVRLAELDAAA